MVRGLLIPLALAAFLLLIVFRLPPDVLGEVVREVLQLVVGGQLLGWALFALSLVGWTWHAHFQRRTYSGEVDRAGREKSLLQVEQLGDSLARSSGRRPAQEIGNENDERGQI
jgi:hypothetical protein